MEVIPAIDLRHGKCVRLYQGDYDRETVFSEDPVAVAWRWQSQGAPRFHLVDLDGAAQGELRNLPAIEAIANRVRLPIQVGGGVRRLEVVEQLFNLGIDRVILGTAALEDSVLVREACQKSGERIIVSIDAKDGYVASHGWRKKSQVTAIELIEQMTVLGVRRFIYTDIARDGTLTSPNFEAIKELVAKTSLPIIASGGVASISHLQRLSQIGVEAVIVGQALYTGNLDLRQAIEAVS